MARSRKMPNPADILPPGDSEALEGADVDPEDMPEGWQLAYSRAMGKGCSDKAARLYADAHGEEFEPVSPEEPAKEPTEEEIKAQIEELQQKLETSGKST
jgi:hypothetical protein